MHIRTLLAAAFALGLSGAAQAQQQQWPGVIIYGSNGQPLGSSGNPIATAPGLSATAMGAIAPTSGGTQSAYVAKASGANLYGFSATMGATAGFMALLNTATAPAASAAITPLECVAIPANGYVARRQDVPDRYTAGLTVVVSSSCTTYTAVAPLVSTVLVQ